jgi:TolB-like protein/DNA-binding winged helix-turn-helix (wHTH) protein
MPKNISSAARPPPAASKDPARTARTFRIGDWTVDPLGNRLVREGREVRLEPRVMDVLLYLAAHQGQVVSRTELEAEVWSGSVVSYDALAGAIQKLRKAFGDDARDPRVIETLSKRGYRLLAAVRPFQDTAERVPKTPKMPFVSRLAGPGAMGLLLTLVVVALALAWFGYWNDVKVVSEKDRQYNGIAVLPFDNLSGDPNLEYFADGVTDDLITELAHSPHLLVIARDSTFHYKGKPLDVQRLADRLNIRYILHGSVRRDGDQVRINAQLVDAPTATHLWAERYTGELQDVFTMEKQIAQRVLSTLVPGNSAQAEPQPDRTDDPRAYDYFLLGRNRFFHYANREENLKARAFYEKAIELDPKFAMAYAMLAWTHAFAAMNGWSESKERSLAQAQALSVKAIEMQSDLPVAYFVNGLAYRERGEYMKALVEAEKAIRIDPNYANAHVLLASLLYYAGRPREGLQRIQHAMRLNPHYPYNYPFHLGQAYFILADYKKAIDALQEGIDTNPASERLHVWMAAALALAGDVGEAHWETEQVLALNPEFSVQRMAKTVPFAHAADRDRFVDGLHRAGLPD